MHADQPSGTADIKLILGGKFLDNGEILNGALVFDSRMLREVYVLCYCSPLYGEWAERTCDPCRFETSNGRDKG